MIAFFDHVLSELFPPCALATSLLTPVRMVESDWRLAR